MEARDAILSWLEKGDNFLRVTASSPFSPSTRRGRINLRDVVQTECQALNELAAFVNQVLPRSTWDARHAKQMLKDYLMEYRSTAEAAANPQFILDEKDELTGIQTVQDRLNAMCRHFQRLQQLHDPVAIATQERERKRMERGNENLQSNGQRQEQPTATRTTNVKVHVDLTESQHSEREEVVPESDLSNSYENSETDRETALKELRSNSTVTGVADKVQEETQRASKKTAKQVVECVQRHEKDNGEGNKDETVSKLKPSKQKMKVKGKKNVTAAKTTQTQNKQEAKSQKQSKEKDEEGKEDEKFPNPLAFSGKSNIERKRALFRAKELAFEQLKWQRENELQQLELTLLRREMEARQSLAQHELKLQRMRMRADLIQPMISAGASAADIAERLKLL
ncbi:hypothetical protein JG687_00009728 [Phytophthora cactorum]|uniref:Uncharacterized protein n=1 Tax=Phytophthora cactorum TaxID=29920 RepID=A0A8T1UDU6_9STRA|nr:hypothetical protein JG687_00009728 [Phytophthora cactorum]